MTTFIVRNGCNSWWEAITRNRGNPGMVGICFMMGEWKIFKASLHSWQRGTNPLFYEVSSILPTPAFSLLLSTPPPLPPLPCHLQPSSPLLFLLFCLFWVNEWSQHIWCAVLLNENMDMHTSNLDTLVPEGSWCLFYVTRCHVYWSLTDNVVF